ncbi:hypothetical protein ALP64_202598 [Pseudomonas syringae pv. actinidiae]|nr:hypothetical protein ALP64_202598 [Pseudomonas syringae pv. actinidiae]
MAFLLLLQALLELIDKLVEAAQRLDLRALFVAQRALELLAQPVFRNQRLQVIVELFQTVEVGTEGAVELVEMALVLDQNRACKKVELIDIGEDDPLFKGIDQVQQFTQRHRHLGRAHFVEQVEQHGCRPFTWQGG